MDLTELVRLLKRMLLKRPPKEDELGKENQKVRLTDWHFQRLEKELYGITMVIKI